MKIILLFANRVVFALMSGRFSCCSLIIVSDAALIPIIKLPPATQEMERI